MEVGGSLRGISVTRTRFRQDGLLPATKNCSRRLMIPPSIFNSLEREAKTRGIDTHEFIREVLKIIVKDNLYKSILD